MSLAYFLTCYPSVFVRPGTGKRPLDWCRNNMSVLYCALSAGSIYVTTESSTTAHRPSFARSYLHLLKVVYQSYIEGTTKSELIIPMYDHIKTNVRSGSRLADS